MENWFESDYFWEHFAPIMFDSQRWAGTSWETSGALQLSNTGPGSRILDSCCGVGRHSLELARRGHQVTAIDRTRAYIQAAEESAAAEEINIEFILGDVRSFCRPEGFDLALNMYTSFGFFEKPDEEMAYIANIQRSLSAGGSFVIDINGKEILARDFVNGEEWEKEGYQIRTSYRIEPGYEILHNTWAICNPEGQTHEFSFSHRIYSAAEIRALLQAGGFAETRVYGSFDGIPYDNNAQRLIVVATK